MSPAQTHSVLKRRLWAVVDCLVWCAGLTLALWLRYDFELSPVRDVGLIWCILLAVALQTVIGYTIGPYARNHQWGSFEETADVSKVTAMVGAILFAAVVLFQPQLSVPRSVPVMGFFLAITGMFAARFIKRSWDTRRVSFGSEARRAIIVGAGQTGRGLVQSMLRDTSSGFAPVAFVDDDPAKSRLRIGGVRVRGSRADIPELAGEFAADVLVVAIPNISREDLTELSRVAEECDVALISVPPVRDQLGARPAVQDLRDVDVSELLGRRQVDLDTSMIAAQLNRKRVLVTGAGGSIGSELCRQIAKFGPSRLFLLDRDESGLQAAQMSITGDGLLDNDEVILADIRDAETVRRIFAETKPDIIFHAAALKHLPLLEKFPTEGWQSNVLGTLNVLTAAAEIEVETFVNVSTDKAANPTCVLGYTKRLAERLTADFATRTAGRFVSVRFGNVLGSRGSVVHIFTDQVTRGGPVTITHPDVERYFMLIPEACQLVLEASVIGSDGEVMVLDMGKPMKIVDVAQTLIRRSGRKDIEINYTGLRPGEKMSEELFADREQRRSTRHELISSVDVPAITPDEVESVSMHDPDHTRSWMKAAAKVGMDERNTDAPAVLAPADLEPERTGAQSSDQRVSR